MNREVSSATSFINLDLELTYSGDLNPLISHLGHNVFVLFNGETESGKMLCLEPLFEGELSNSIENCINHFVYLLKGMPAELTELWNSCGSRVFDLGFQGGLEQPPFQTSIPSSVLKEIADLNIEIRITIYSFSESSECNA